ncbi:hypothetical protein F2P56_030677 [Juglans regia]|uniref:DUF4283 domain-containing protein n=2 Tax=Juglans regia TaxID=51240 RepID=A0A833UE02_JUGRE|nr:uncharacterized protein LOC109003943 [Juglans regia]KAF5450314.1 hypothetical protein F2P56_030677 [Juglans regia]
MRYPVDVDGEPGLVFTEPEMSTAAEDFRFAIVLKFVRMRPTIDDVRLAIIKSWGLLEIPTVSVMDDYHVLVKMQTERDFMHAWARKGRLIAGSVFRLFRWTKDFDLWKESTLAPQWIFLPGLPLHMYRADFLQILATRFGRFLGIDNATLHRTRVSGAQMCVEIDMTDEPVQRFPIVMGNKKIWQEVWSERPGFYCTKCCRQGHTTVVCRASEEVVRKGRDVAKGVGRKIWQEIPKQKSLQAVPGDGLKEVQKEDGVAMEVVNRKEVVVPREETKTIFRGERVNIDMKMVEEPCEEEEVVEQPSIQMLREVEVVRGVGSDMDLILVYAYKSPRSGGHGQAKMVSAVLDMECHLQPVIVEEPPDSYGTDVEANVLDLAKNKGYDSDSVSQQGEDKLQRLVSSLGFDGFYSNEGAGGKISILWRAPYDFEVVSVSTQMVTGWFVFDGTRTLVSFVYAKCTQLDRRELWEQLVGCRATEDPWIVMGDFNIIREDRERVGGCPRAAQAMDDFNLCIDQCGLVELNYHGNPLSWCNGQEGVSRKWARLDRVLMNMAFSDRFNLAQMEYIKRKTLDHSPMVIRLILVNTRYGPSPFRFQKMWCSHGSFQKLVEETWKQPTVGSGMVKLAAKLKRLKMGLRIWNKSVSGRVDTNIQELEARMAVLEAQLQSGFSEEIEAEYIVTKLEIDIWEKREESRLAQLATNKWLKEGDQNSKFFHAVVSHIGVVRLFRI